MSKKHEARSPDPKTADYQRKESIIARLKPKTPPETIEAALLEMGEAIAANPSLSNSQQDKFVQALISIGLLTYQATYLARADEIDKQTTSLTEREKLKIERKLVLDSVAWDIEKKGTLQAQTVLAAWQMSQSQIEREDQIAILAQLINAGHLATRTDSLFETPYDGPEFQVAVVHAEAIENTIFDRRMEYAVELVPLGLFDPDEDWGLQEMGVDGFRASASYDSMVALHFLHQLTGQTMCDRFIELQPVLHFGYSIGVRDANQAGARKNL